MHVLYFFWCIVTACTPVHDREMDSFDGNQAFISDGSSPDVSAAEIPAALLNDMGDISLDPVLPHDSSNPDQREPEPAPVALAAAAAAAAAAEVAAVHAQSEGLSPGQMARDQVQGERTPGGAVDVDKAMPVCGGGEQLEALVPPAAATEEPAKAKAERKAEAEHGGEDDDEGDDDGDDEFEWGAAKHIFVLSSAGKPVFSLLGDEQRLSTLMGLIQALLSLCADCDDGDEMESITAGSRRFVFLKRGNLVLVAVSSSETGMLGNDHDAGSRSDVVRGEKDAPECESFMRLQLEYLYASILFLLTSKVCVCVCVCLCVCVCVCV